MSWRVFAAILIIFPSLALAQLPADNGKAFQDDTGQFGTIATTVEAQVKESKLPLKVYIAPKAPNANELADQLLTEWKMEKDGIVLVLVTEGQGVAVASGDAQRRSEFTREYVSTRIAKNYFAVPWQPEPLQKAILKTVKALRIRTDIPPNRAQALVASANAAPMMGGGGGGASTAPPVETNAMTKPPMDLKIAVPILIVLVIALIWLIGRTKKTA